MRYLTSLASPIEKNILANAIDEMAALLEGQEKDKATEVSVKGSI